MYTNINASMHRYMIRSIWSKEIGIVAVAGGGQDVVGDDVAQRPPREHVDDVEPDRVVGLEQAGVLLRPLVAGLEVRYPVLLRQPLLRHVLALEAEEDEAAEEERQPRAEANHQRRAQLRPDRRSRPADGLDGDGPGLGTPEGVHGLEGAEAGEGGEESGGSHRLIECGGGRWNGLGRRLWRTSRWRTWGGK